MSDAANTAEEAIERLKRNDPTLQWIDLFPKQHSDAEVAELADCLLAHPDVVAHVRLTHNRLTDETGVKLARYVAASSTIEYLILSNNQLGSATYLAVAAALRVNTSLRYLDLNGNQANNKCLIDAAFVESLRLNRSRPVFSVMYLYSWSNKFSRLQKEAEELGHPTLQLLLSSLLDAPKRQSS